MFTSYERIRPTVFVTSAEPVGRAILSQKAHILGQYQDKKKGPIGPLILSSLRAVDASPIGPTETITLTRFVSDVSGRKVRFHRCFHACALEHLETFALVCDRSQQEESVWVVKIVINSVTTGQNASASYCVEIVVSSTYSLVRIQNSISDAYQLRRNNKFARLN